MYSVGVVTNGRMHNVQCGCGYKWQYVVWVWLQMAGCIMLCGCGYMAGCIMYSVGVVTNGRMHNVQCGCGYKWQYVVWVWLQVAGCITSTKKPP